MTKLSVTVLALAGFCGLGAVSAHAGDLDYPPPPPYYPPLAYGAPVSVGFVFRRHDWRCDYPRGFSVTDFTKNVNGIPRDTADLVSSGCATYDPLSP